MTLDKTEKGANITNGNVLKFFTQLLKKHAKAIFCFKYLATWSAGKD